MTVDESIFKAYDIRGIYPSEINEEVCERIGVAFANVVKPKVVAVGRDVRTSGIKLQAAIIAGLVSQGVDVIDIGVGPTEQLYFAVATKKLDGGIQVSASHNPAQYNGLKMVRGLDGQIDALSADNLLPEIKSFVLSNQAATEVEDIGRVETADLHLEYLEYLTNLIDLTNIKPLKIVANNNFGVSGPLAKQVIEKLELPIELIELNFEPDGSFPKGRPDPLVPENRAETSNLVREHKADFGVAWDADGDRFFVADEHGEFVDGCYLTAMLARTLLKDHPGEKIIYDPRNIWAVENAIKEGGGVPLMNKAGHTYIKNRMCKEDALMAGEMSGHYSFRDFFYCDNGIIPFLYFLKIAGQSEKTVSELFQSDRANFPVSGELNFKVKDIAQAMKAIEEFFPDAAKDRTDGVSLSYATWRLNLRGSNTEPLLRLNVEAKNKEICLKQTNLVVEQIRYHCE